MQALTQDGQRIVDDIAARHNFSGDAVSTLLMAFSAGRGRQAQFNHPELGGMGQWSQGGMIMIGDMFNQGLKHRVEQLCSELSAVLPEGSSLAGGVSLFVTGTPGHQWPLELGSPASVGSQNDLHYAVFPSTRRLAISRAGRVTVYDTGDHQIAGVSQQQSGDQWLTFTSQHGLVRVADLKIITPESADAAPAQPASAAGFLPPVESTPPAAPGPERTAGSLLAAPAQTDDELFSKLERLAELRKKDIITAEEFDAKKAEILARL